LRGPDGGCSYLDGGNGLMGVEDSPYQTFERSLAPGTTVVLYTDGLIERRGESLDVGLERLASACRSGPEAPTPLRDYILARLVEPGTQRYDDVTTVVARLSDESGERAES
jgi:serine phosphatase RsbU (regulator of sigma subunit)